MDLAEHGDEALVVDLLFLGGERLAAAELFEHVVNAGEREAGMLLLLPLAVRIEPLAERADALLERGFGEISPASSRSAIPAPFRNPPCCGSGELHRGP